MGGGVRAVPSCVVTLARTPPPIPLPQGEGENSLPEPVRRRNVEAPQNSEYPPSMTNVSPV
jgi:hypothetical protein